MKKLGSSVMKKDFMPQRRGHDQLWKCAVCQSKFRLRGALRQHMLTHGGLKPFPCSTCGKRFTSKSTLKQHIVRTHSGDRPYSCPTCAKTFTTKHLRIAHMLTHGGERPPPCLTCGRIFPNQRGLRVHVNHAGHAKESLEPALSEGFEVRVGRQPELCPTCGKAFSGHEHLKAHMLTHGSEERFECSAASCGRKFKFRSRKTFIKHMLAHSVGRPWECSSCGKNFTRNTALKQHIMRSHTGDRLPFECSTCGEQFTMKCLLHVHKRATHRDKKFECYPCGMTFGTKYLLSGHNLINHGGEEPFGTGSSSADVEHGMCFLDVKQQIPDDVKPVFLCSTADVKPDVSSDYSNTDMCSDDVHPDMCSDDVPSDMCSDDVKPDVSCSDHVNPVNSSVDLKPDVSFDFEYVKPELRASPPIVTGHRCPLCCHQFAVQTRLHTHLGGHCEDSCFRCETCNCAFTTQYILNSHIRVNHSKTILGL